MRVNSVLKLWQQHDEYIVWKPYVDWEALIEWNEPRINFRNLINTREGNYYSKSHERTGGVALTPMLQGKGGTGLR